MGQREDEWRVRGSCYPFPLLLAWFSSSLYCFCNMEVVSSDDVGLVSVSDGLDRGLDYYG